MNKLAIGLRRDKCERNDGRYASTIFSGPETETGHSIRTLFDMSVASFSRITLDEANDALVAWGHKMGALHRGNQDAVCHGLFHGDKLVAVTAVSTLITPSVGGELPSLTRENCCELSRLCAERSGLCRVAIRLWREFVFPSLGYEYAISYQDSDLHSGSTYRFDGWHRAHYSRSGNDSRSGRKGRNKWVWVWPCSRFKE
jgi:hypothetical protein